MRSNRDVIRARIGANVRRARERIEPNRSEFARRMGVDRTTIQKIEDGERMPSLRNLFEIVRLCGVSADEIMFGPDSAPDQPG